MGLEYIEYMFGGLLYFFSEKFRQKKQSKWKNESQMYKIYEIGMWISIPIISCLLIVAVVFQ